MAQARGKRRAKRMDGTQQGPPAPAVAGGVLWRELGLLVVCLEIAIFMLAFDPSLDDVFDLTKATFTHGVAWGLFGIVVVIGLTSGVRVPVSPLFLAFCALIAVEVLTTLTAENRYVAVYGEVGRYLGLTTHLVLALIAVAIALTLDYPRRAAWLGWAIGAASAAAAIYAIVQWTGHDPVRWVEDPRVRPFATFGNPDFYGQFLAAVFIACAAVLAFARQRLWIAVLVAALGLLSGGLMLVVATRGSLLGVVAGALVIAVLWLRRTELSRRALVRFGVAASIAGVALAIVLLATPLGGRLLDIGRGVGLRDRVLLYQSAVQMFVDHPLIGVGFENFAVAYPRYQQAEWFQIAGPNTTNTSAHNWVLHAAATTGVLGLVASVVLLAAFAWHAWRRARDPDATAVFVALAAAAAFYGSGLVLPGAQSIQWIPWACVGVALASELRTARFVRVLPPVRISALAQSIIVIVFALVLFWQLGNITASRAAKSAQSALGAGSAAQAVAFARTATSSDPGRAVYWNDLGRALDLALELTGARAAYTEAVARSPYTPAFLWNLAQVQQKLAERNEPGAREAAYETMRRAIAANPQNADTFDRFARMQIALGDYSGALQNETQAIVFFPTNTSYYSVAADAAHKLRDDAAAIELLRRGVAATDANDLRVTLARRLIEAGRLPEARQVLRDALAKEPTNAAALDLQREIGAQ